MQRLLNLCEEIEQQVARIYRYWQKVFDEEPSLSGLWGKLADDELDHVRQVQLAKRVVNENVLEESGVSIEELNTALARARQLYKDVQVKNVSAEQALHAAIRIEESFSKAHLLNATKVTDASLQAMFKSLARADELHIGTLRDYVQAYLRKG